jgi:alpha-tubulin suppressor-like RCC1 family protein
MAHKASSGRTAIWRRRRAGVVTMLAATLSMVGGYAAPAHAAAPVSGSSVTPGGVVAWGSNTQGQVGNGFLPCVCSSGPPATQALAARVSGLDGGVQQVSGGFDHSLALMTDGTVRGWGDGRQDEVGTGQGTFPTAITVTGLSGITSVAAGQGDSFAVTSAGQVLAWGDQGGPGLGDPTRNNSLGRTFPPFVVPGPTSIVQVVATVTEVIALGSDGRVWTWGDNTAGELGDPSNTSNFRATAAVVPGITTAVGVTAIDHAAYALLANGTVMSWGRNDSGQLGIGTQTPFERTPQQVVGLTNGVQLGVSGGGGVMRVLLADGTVAGWGANFSGANLLLPAPVPGLTGIRQLANNAALTTGGQVLVWGDNSKGQFGDGTLNTTPGLHTVIGLAAVTQLVSGSDFLLAVTNETPPGVTVPNTGSRSCAGGAAIVSAAGLSPVCTAPNGYIGSTSPALGFTVPRGTTVTLLMDEVVTDLTGMTCGGATATLNAMSLVAYCLNPNGTVLSQSESAGTVVPSGWTVYLTMQPYVPDVVGDTRATAVQIVQAQGLVASTFTVSVNESSDGGKVVGVTPAPGTPVAAGSTVHLAIGVWNGSHL